MSVESPELFPCVDAMDLTRPGPARDAALLEVRAACLDPGYLCLGNLLQASSTYDAVLGLAERFFAYEDNDPIKARISVNGRSNAHGWTPIFGEPAYQPGTVAHVESFDCGRPARGADGPAHQANRWPEVDGFRTTVRRLWTEWSATGMSVMRAIAEAFELDAEFLTKHCATQDLSTLRLLHYPPVDAEAARDAVGIAAHTDFECITLIAQTAAGLELRDSSGLWCDAPASPDQVVVLLGDMLERWTNGHIQATEHRVRPRPFRRYSVVMFFAVDDDVVVAPTEPFVSDRNPTGYAASRQSEHIRRELRRAEENRDALTVRGT